MNLQNVYFHPTKSCHLLVYCFTQNYTTLWKHDLIIEWIRGCLKSKSISVIVNGSSIEKYSKIFFRLGDSLVSDDLL